MIPSGTILARDLCDYLRKAFVGVRFREPAADGNPFTEDGRDIYREPRISLGNLRAKRSDEEQGEDVPYVLIKSYGGDVKDLYKPTYLVPIDIVYAVYAPENDPEGGMEDIDNMGLVIMSALTAKSLYCGGLYKHEGPLVNIHGTGTTPNPYESGLQVTGDYYQGMIRTFFCSADLPEPQD